MERPQSEQPHEQGQEQALERLGEAAGKKPASDDGRGPGLADLQRAREPGRGRQAETPLEVPPRGWKDILLRTKREVSEDQLSLVAAGVAFYFMLALFPALLAELEAPVAQAAKEAFAKLSAAEIDTLLDLLERLRSTCAS